MMSHQDTASSRGDEQKPDGHDNRKSIVPHPVWDVSELTDPQSID